MKNGQPVQVISVDEVQTAIQRIKVSQLSVGTYLMQVQSREGVLAKKFIIVE